MSHERPNLTLERFQRTLAIFYDRVSEIQFEADHRLVGTAAALLHGVDLPVNDIDILVKERTAVDGFSQALSAYTCVFAPEWLDHSHQYFASYDVDGVQIGFSTVEVDSDRDTIETFGAGPWVHYSVLPCGRCDVPTVALELRLHTELHRNRPDRYAPILSYLGDNGCDHRLMRRCIEYECDLDDARKSLVHEMLRSAPSK